MDSEYNSLMENKTWVLSRLPEGRLPTECKWVYKLKQNAEGIVVRRKSRLVVKGFTQVAFIDYNEPYAPVIKGETIRMMLAFGVKYGLKIMQLDVTTAFLHADIDEGVEIYMRQPPGYEKYDEEGFELFCKLMKSLYGLKQASRNWNKHLDAG